MRLGFLAACAAAMMTAGACTTAATTQKTAEFKAVEENSTKVPLGAVEVEDEDGDRKVCKRTIKTGSRFPVVTCMTVAEWRALQEQSRDFADDFSRRNTQVDVPNGI